MTGPEGTPYATRCEILPDGRTQKIELLRNGAPLPYAEVLRLWRESEPFRTVFLAALVDAPFAVYRWETPPVRADRLDRTFECVVRESPEIDLPADGGAFASHFATTEGDVVTFPNLGHDAVLVVPTPRGSTPAYAHLASFVRGGSREQNHALWEATGCAMERRVRARDKDPVWLSTAGGGVPWLHVRLDDFPKYYSYAPYRNENVADGRRAT